MVLLSRRSAHRPGIGLIGCGTIARYQHLPHLARLRAVRLMAVCDPDPELRERIGRRYGVAGYEDLDAMLAHPGLEAVVIASPSVFHADQATAAARAGKSIYLEKPLATSADEASRLLAAAPASPLVAMGFNYRFHPLFREARRLLRDGAAGEIQAVQHLLTEPLAERDAAGWRARRASGGGAGLDLGSHQVDLLRWLLGLEVVAVREARVEAGRIDQQALTMTLDLAGGVEAQCTSRFAGGPRDRLELVGSRATLVLDRHAAELRLHAARRRKYGTRELPTGSGRALAPLRLRRLVQPSWEPSFALALRAFAAALGDAAAPQASDLARLGDGAASLSVVLAAERAAASHAAATVQSLFARAGA